jgi:hypothetical protein
LINLAQWNRHHPIGTAVRAWPGTRKGTGLRSETRSKAWALHDGTPVVAVNGHDGGIGLSHVDVLP